YRFTEQRLATRRTIRIGTTPMPSAPSDSFSASYDKTTKWISAGIFVLLLVATYAWSPRSYTISERSILVKRLIGSVRIPLDRIREARIATPDDFRDCIRLLGNGGPFGYYGQLRTARLCQFIL